MAAIFNSPSKYIQGPDELAKLGSYVEPLGAKALVIVTPSGKKRVGAKIEGGFAEAKAELLFEDFNGECSKGEVDRLVALARDNGCDIIPGYHLPHHRLDRCPVFGTFGALHRRRPVRQVPLP